MTEELIAAVTAWREAMKALDVFEPILKPLVEKERELRNAVIAAAFADGQENHEGTTNLEIWPGWVLKTVIRIDRKVDEAALEAALVQLQKMLINTDILIRRKPELVLKMYRELSDEARKVFDQCLEVKPASPRLELIQKLS